ncbi:S4 domain protein [Peptostreptococcaceae bacterium AS15]|nr:S4 domain protein [[Eubacterium] yurii subsp. margaretiae ATCC 43715]EJP20209.1 S4 domain protein [Peptostreptococcaceae bacterium AS15]
MEIIINTEFIKLDQLLKLADITSSGAESHALITDGKVKVNGQVELQKRKKIRENDIVEVNKKVIQVIFDADK